MIDLAGRLIRGQQGATAAEYAMMTALLGAALVTAGNSLADAIGGRLSSVSRSIGADRTPSAPPISPPAAGANPTGQAASASRRIVGAEAPPRPDDPEIAGVPMGRQSHVVRGRRVAGLERSGS
jgi:Flp pilus assembly pilin Flp